MALEGGEGSASCPGRSLPPGKTWYPLYRRLGGPQGQSAEVWKILPPPGFNPRTVQPIASRYTNYIEGINAYKIVQYLENLKRQGHLREIFTLEDSSTMYSAATKCEGVVGIHLA